MLLRWYRQPARDVSEAVLRLRRLRGLTQEQLAERMRTKQPAVARLERGHENTTLKTLIAVAEALDATVRIDLDPAELLGREPRGARWWEQVSAPAAAMSALSSGCTVPSANTPAAVRDDVGVPDERRLGELARALHRGAVEVFEAILRSVLVLVTAEDDPETSAYYRVRVLVDLAAEVDGSTEARAVLALHRVTGSMLSPEERQAVRFLIEVAPRVEAAVPAATGESDR